MTKAPYDLAKLTDAQLRDRGRALRLAIEATTSARKDLDVILDEMFASQEAVTHEYTRRGM